MNLFFFLYTQEKKYNVIQFITKSFRYTANVLTYGAPYMVNPMGSTHLCPPLRSTFAVRETASLSIMGAPRVPPLNPSETIVF